MSRDTALLTFGIGPVHSFIAQARRIADVWAGSHLLSHLIRQAMTVVHYDSECQMLFPALERRAPIPNGLPNRFVARVPLARAGEIAAAMRREVERVWRSSVDSTIRTLASYSLWPTENERRWRAQTERLLDFAWSWVSEDGDYAAASAEGAQQYAAVRRFRPFEPMEEDLEKCAICGERTALPGGRREEVQKAWKRAAEAAKGKEEERYLRLDQGRLCLVCCTKRFFPADEDPRVSFEALDRFQPSEKAPYLAIVKVDGDHMGDILGIEPEAIAGGRLEEFHRQVSAALAHFTEQLRIEHSSALNLEVLGGYKPAGLAPQLIYAGGDDALFVCDPRDALPLARKLHARYGESFERARELLLHEVDRRRFTLSGAIVFAHSGHPAGLLLRDLEELLKNKAKAEAGRDALALRLDKRGGAPVEVAFHWDEAPDEEDGESWLSVLDRLATMVQQGKISSRQTFTLRLEEQTLSRVFLSRDEWERWLADRLSRNEETSARAQEMAALMAPFFHKDRTEALRIARFLGREVTR